MSKLRDMVSNLVSLKRITEGNVGAKPPHRWATFCNFLNKIAILMPLDHI